MSVKRSTDLSEATINGAAIVYDESFSAATFYVSRCIYGGLPAEQAVPIHHVKNQQFVYRGIANNEIHGACLPGSEYKMSRCQGLD